MEISGESIARVDTRYVEARGAAEEAVEFVVGLENEPVRVNVTDDERAYESHKAGMG